MSEIRLIIDYENGNLKSVTGEAEDEFKKSGKKSGSDFSKSFSSGIKSATKVVAGLAAAVGAVGTVTLFKSIAAAREQEDAVNRLNGALRSSGDFSDEASKDLQDYASSLQEVSTIGDEVALGQLALAKGFGASNEQAKEIVSAAADLSVALGIDLESATRNVAKTLGGYAGELGEVIPELKNFTQEQLKTGAAIDIIANKFQGLAQNQTQTFSGALAQATNSVGDFFEKIGAIVTQNPLIIKGLNAVTTSFQEFGKNVEEFAKSFNIFDDVITPILNFNNAFITFVIAPFEQLLNVGNIVQQGLNVVFARILSGVGNLGLGIATVLDKLGIGETLAADLKVFEDTSEQVAREAGVAFQTAYEGVSEFPLSERLATKNEDLRTFFAEQRDIIAEETAITDEITNEQVEKVAETSQSFASLLVDTFKGVSFQINKTKEEMAAVAKQTANIVRNGLARGISGGIQNIIQSLAAGENVFANFGKFILSTIGDLAIQLGTFFIAEGIAVEALNAVSGTGAIAAGAALVALGSILKASAGGGGASASAGGGGSGAVSSPVFADSNVEEEEDFLDGAGVAQTQTIVNFNVDGNVRGDEATIRELVQDIGDEGGKQGLVFNNFATA